MNTTYRLKISLAKPLSPITQLHRVVDVDGGILLGKLVDEIGVAFDVKLSHWRFFVSRIKMDNLTKLQELGELNNHQTSFYEMLLQEKEYCYLEANDFLYRIRIEKITHASLNQPLVLIKSVGVLPLSDDINNNKSELQFEALLISALMMVVGEEKNPVRASDLMEMGIFDELTKRGWIKPCVSPSHRIKLTLMGESVLQNFMERVGLPDELQRQ